jgi:hypothetical protein
MKEDKKEYSPIIMHFIDAYHTNAYSSPGIMLKGMQLIGDFFPGDVGYIYFFTDIYSIEDLVNVNSMSLTPSIIRKRIEGTEYGFGSEENKYHTFLLLDRLSDEELPSKVGIIFSYGIDFKE